MATISPVVSEEKCGKDGQEKEDEKNGRQRERETMLSFNNGGI
jgi:hypothetical protein